MYRLIILLCACLLGGNATAETTIRFSNDWKWEGPHSWLLMAKDDGYFKDEGLNVTLEPGKGSVQAIPRVASGEFDMGSADINSLIKYRDANPDMNLKGVFVIYNSPPFAVIGRPSQGVVGPADLEGKVLGAPAADGAFAQWDAFVAANGIKSNKVTIQDVGFPVRESMLADGNVDAITGFSFSSLINLKARNVPLSDISLMLMSDFGLDMYGNVIIVNPQFAKDHPDAVRSFLRAAVKGIQNTVANPTKAVKYVMAHNETAVEEVELDRLIMAIGYHIVNDEVRQNGLGGVSYERLERSIEQISRTYEFTNRPSSNDVFDESYLPAAAQRMLEPL
jgi:NitT/TauT family transport system substrate-binding protein